MSRYRCRRAALGPVSSAIVATLLVTALGGPIALAVIVGAILVTAAVIGFRGRRP